VRRTRPEVFREQVDPHKMGDNMIKLTGCRLITVLVVAAASAPSAALAGSAPSLTQSQQAQLESYQQATARLFGITPGGLAGPAGGPLTLAEIQVNVAAMFVAK
jgi:hypothetical protein